MDPVNPVRLSRLYEDVDWVERPRGARRGDKKTGRIPAVEAAPQEG